MNTDITYCTGGKHFNCLLCGRNRKLHIHGSSIVSMMNPPDEAVCSLFFPYTMSGGLLMEDLSDEDLYGKEFDRLELGDPVDSFTLCPMCGRTHEVFSKKCGNRTLNFYKCNGNTYIYGIDGRMILNKENV